jgi:hypothetical protein
MITYIQSMENNGYKDSDERTKMEKYRETI